jgi:peroxiredoxin
MKTFAFVFALVMPLAFVAAQDAKKQDKPAEKAEAKGYEVGSTVADFTLNDATGKSTSLKSIAEGKKYVVVSYWSRECPAAQHAEVFFAKINADYASKGVALVYMASNKKENKTEADVKATKDYVANKKITWPVLLDVDNKIALTFGATNTPHVYVIDAKTMKVVYTGSVVDSIWKPENVKKEYVRDALDQLLAGKPVTTASTKPDGCTIKRVVE